MNRLGKAAIITACLFLALAIGGGICLAIGIVSSSAGQEFVDTLTDYVENQSITSDSGSGRDIDGEYTFSLDSSVAEIELEKIAGEITIVPSDSDVITVRCEGTANIGDDEPFVYCEWDDDKLILGSNAEFDSGIKLRYYDVKLEILIPASFSGKLSFEKTAAEITIADLTLDELEFSKTTGEIDISNVTVGKFECDATVGEVNFDGEISCIEIEDTVGECNIVNKGILSAPCTIEDNIGEITLKLADGNKVDLSTKNCLGEVHIDTDIRVSDGTPFEIENSIGEVNISSIS